MKNKKPYCTNCGKFGHMLRECNLPITSLGIISVKLDLPIDNNFINLLNQKKYIDIDEYNYENIQNLKYLDFFKNKIKFMVIQKKHSNNYIEFIRGKYSIDDENKIIKMLSLMSKHELNLIKSLDFKTLWNNLWLKTSKNKIYEKEFIQSQKLFYSIRKNNIFKKIMSLQSIYNTPEWEFPKGRRNNFEKNIDCAIREFYEETGISKENIILINYSQCLIKEFIGTNNKNYKHIYYLSLCNNNNNIEQNIISKNEIGNIKWCNFDEALSLFRNYEQQKIDLITKAFLFYVNIYINNQKDKTNLSIY